MTYHVLTRVWHNAWLATAGLPGHFAAALSSQGRQCRQKQDAFLSKTDAKQLPTAVTNDEGVRILDKSSGIQSQEIQRNQQKEELRKSTDCSTCLGASHDLLPRSRRTINPAFVCSSQDL
jgi:hypothetical protein